MDEATVLTAPAPNFPVLFAERLAREVYGVDGTATPLVSERDQNFRIEMPAGRRYVLKIANPAESYDVLDFQNGAMLHARRSDPALLVPGVAAIGDSGETIYRLENDGTRYLVRLVDYLGGDVLSGRTASPALRRSIGAMVARLDNALRGYFHPAARHELWWDVSRISSLRALFRHIVDGQHRALCTRLLDQFEAGTQPLLPALRAQVIHNDANPANVLTAPEDPHSVSALIDFGDIVHAPMVNDLAVAAAYQALGRNDPMGAVCDVVCGYHARLPLADDEIVVLPELITARLLTSATVSEWRAREHPDNRDYILGDMAVTWATLSRLADIDGDASLRRLREACGLAPLTAAGRGAATTETLTARRRRALSDGLSLFYDEPLRVVRGEGVWLYDADGNRYLDCYNNVAQAGHCHPQVSAAIAKQSRLLNTNTRYLYDGIVEYAEQLTATLPAPLSVCYFVCTGSEANDLALQIAREVSGHTGAIVSEHAYHGNTSAVAQLSPEDTPAERREDWVELVAAPDVYAGKFRGDTADSAARYAADVDRAVAALNDRGHGCAAIYFDTIFSSNGIFLAPGDYLARAWASVRAAGGLCVADEVQAGFGRTGENFWGFAAAGVVPDIVTIGKPMGNGHPIAAVITTPDIAARFSKARSYFNTFGGNPVSCAAGMAVLNVTQRERLQDNARSCGRFLRSGLDELAGRFECIGDVRGAGLFIGVELVADRESRAPDAGLAGWLVNELRRNGVLISRTGPRDNVLKIRPPLVFGEAHAERLLDALEQALTTLPAHR